MDAPTHIISFSQAIDFNKFDIVHSHGIRPDAYVFFHKPKACSARCISTLHSYLNIDLSYQYNAFVAFFAVRIWRFLLKKHDKIVVLSKDAKRYYQKWFQKKTIKVAYNATELKIPDDEPLAFESDIIQLKKQFSIIGANALLTKRKRIDLLIKALPLLSNYALVIVGDGKERKHLEHLALRNKVADRCLFTGYQKNAYRYLKFYDIFAMPSCSEGFPLALLEAAMYKKNTICSNIPLFHELFSEKDVTFFELDHVESLANAILSANQTHKGQQLYETCLNQYSIAHFIESYKQVYTT